MKKEYLYQEKWQKKTGLISKSYKLQKNVVEKFTEACKRSNTTQAKQLTKMMNDYIDNILKQNNDM